MRATLKRASANAINSSALAAGLRVTGRRHIEMPAVVAVGAAVAASTTESVLTVSAYALTIAGTSAAITFVELTLSGGVAVGVGIAGRVAGTAIGANRSALIDATIAGY
ncbi:MAG: hypothetical protein JKY61_04290 [Planctomycetes bacterium]|nr:hypothetical protein [Planctomycetota bacterium]